MRICCCGILHIFQYACPRDGDSKCSYYFWTHDIVLYNSFHSLKLRTHIGTCSNWRNCFSQCSWAVGVSQEPIPDRIRAFNFATFLELCRGDAEVTIKLLRISMTRMKYLPHRNVAEMSLLGLAQYSALRELVIESCLRAPKVAAIL